MTCGAADICWPDDPRWAERPLGKARSKNPSMSDSSGWIKILIIGEAGNESNVISNAKASPF